MRSRAGSPKYQPEGIELFLDAAEEVEPVEANEWAMVENIYNKAALDSNYTERNSKSLKKFNRLVANRKRKGDHRRPPEVR